MDEDFRKQFEPSGSALYLVKNENNYIEFDNNLVKVDTFNYRVASSYTVRINLEDVYTDNNFNVVGIGADRTKLSELQTIKDNNQTFK